MDTVVNQLLWLMVNNFLEVGQLASGPAGLEGNLCHGALPDVIALIPSACIFEPLHVGRVSHGILFRGGFVWGPRLRTRRWWSRSVVCH